MSDFEFEVYGGDGATPVSNGGGNWKEMQEYVVKTCGLQGGDTLVGYISQIIDLGVQTPEDSEYVFDGDAEKEAAEKEANPLLYFKDGVDDKGKPVRLKCAPQKPTQHITFSVDFPEILLDKGQFFGDESGEMKPLRLYLGGEFYKGAEIGTVIQNPLSMKNTTGALGGWSFDPKSTIYKMAYGAKLISDGELFDSKRIGELLGKSLQFNVQIFFKEGKQGKSYFTQRIKYAAGLGRNLQPIDHGGNVNVLMFNRENNEQAIKELPKVVLNTVKQAKNYVGSKIAQQITSLHSDNKGGSPTQAAPAASAASQEASSGTDAVTPY